MGREAGATCEPSAGPRSSDRPPTPMPIRPFVLAALAALAACDSGPGPAPDSVTGVWEGAITVRADASTTYWLVGSEPDSIRCTGEITTRYLMTLEDDGGSVTGSLRVRRDGALTVTHGHGQTDTVAFDDVAEGELRGVYEPPLLTTSSTGRTPSWNSELLMEEERARLLAVPWTAGVRVHGIYLACTPTGRRGVFLDRVG